MVSKAGSDVPQRSKSEGSDEPRQQQEGEEMVELQHKSDAWVDAEYKDQKQKSVANRNVKIKMPLLELLRNAGPRELMVQLRWRHLLFIVILFYIAGGAVFGAILYGIGKSDGDALDFWYRGVNLLMINIVWDVQYGGEMVLASFVPVIGTLIALMLFGVLYEKFSFSPSVLVLADDILLRRLPSELGGHTMLTVRVAHIEGKMLANPEVRMLIAKRYRDENGEGIMRGINVVCDYETIPMLPPATFLTHTITPDSPLYSPDKPYNADFQGIMRFFVSVQATDPKMLNTVIATADWGLGCFQIDRSFRSLYQASSAKGAKFNYEDFQLSDPIPAPASFSGDSQNPATLADFGLPESSMVETNGP